MKRAPRRDEWPVVVLIVLVFALSGVSFLNRILEALR